jgi:hypothetical protein
LTKDRDGLEGALLARSEIYARLFAMIFALLECSERIDRTHLESALAWVDYWRGSVAYLFGSPTAAARLAEVEQNASELLEYIRANPDIKRADLTKTFKHSLKAEAITEALTLMLNGAPPQIIETHHPRADGGKGKGSISYRAV